MPGLDPGISCRSAKDRRVTPGDDVKRRTPAERSAGVFACSIWWRPSPGLGDARHQPPSGIGRPIVKRDMTRM